MPVSTSARIPTKLLIGTGAVIFLANAGLLVLQLVAGKLLSPFIGSSIETWTSVIGIFLTGIALGNWLGGRLADRFPSPRTVALLLIFGGLASLGMILCYKVALASGFYHSIPLRPRIPILAAMFCLVPALLLSLLTPLTIKLILPDVASAGRIAGLVFALSTLGCLLGNYLTGFWLMAYLTLDQIILGVGLGLAALSIPIFFVKKRGANDAAPPDSLTQSPAAEEAAAPDSSGWSFVGQIKFAYAVVFITSFCGMSLELTGSRVLAPLLGVSLFSWTGIIGVMLAGTAAGNFIGGILADRGVAAALRRFAVIMSILIGAAAAPVCASELGLKHWLQGRLLFHYVQYESAVRLFGAALALVMIIPGIWLSKTRLGGYFVTALVGGVLGAALAHTTGRAIDGQITFETFTRFHQALSERAGFDVGELLIHGLGFVAGAGLALLFAWDAPPRGKSIPRPAALSGSLFLAAVMTFAILLLLGVFSHCYFMFPPDIVGQVLAWTFAVFFLPMLLLGTISPQVIRMSVPNLQSAGRTAGSIYAWSTAGAIAGTFTTGYFLISAVGTFRVLMILAFVLTVLAFLTGKLWRYNAMLYAGSITCGGAIFGLFIVGFGTNRYNLETNYYAIRVTEYKDGYRDLTLDHLLHSSANLNDPTWLFYQHEYVQGELLLEARSRHDRVHLLVIGGGGYTFPHYVECVMPDVDVEVVEIDPGVTKIAYEKMGLPRDTKIRTHNLDGRQFISEMAPRGHYQLVMQDAVNDLSVPGHLMTREYNDAVKATLTPDGAYLLTLIDSLRDGRLWRAAVHTMRQSFKFVYVLGPDEMEKDDGRVAVGRAVWVLYGSDTPLNLESIHLVVDSFREKRLKDDAQALALVAPQVPYELAKPKSPWLRVFTHALKDQTLDRILDEVASSDGKMIKFEFWDPDLFRFTNTIILRDQYCPVDNLMSEVFRERAEQDK